MTSISKVRIGVAGVAILAGAAPAAHAQSAPTTATPQWGSALKAQGDSASQPAAATQSGWGTAASVQTSSTVQAKPAAATVAKQASTQSVSGVGTGQTTGFGSNSSQVSVPSAATLGQQNPTGLNGQALGQQDPIGLNDKALGGQQDPTGINGQLLGAQASGGGGTADQNGGQGMHFNNGGVAGVSEDSGTADTAGADAAAGGGNQQGYQPDFMSPQGTGGKVLGEIWSHIAPDSPPADPKPLYQATAGVRGSATGEFENKSGGRNATGQLVNKGNMGGGDSGGGQTDEAGGTPGANATGQTFNNTHLSGSDASPQKAKDATPIDANKLNNGAIDPKRGG